MPVIAPTPITELPTPPVLSDISTFSSRTDAFINALPTFRSQNNDLASNVFNNATQAAADATAAYGAIAAANYKGLWSTLTGALNIPASVSHSGKIWLLTANLADVTTATPGVSGSWLQLNNIPDTAGHTGKFLSTLDGTSVSWASIKDPTVQTLTATGTLTDGMVVALRSDGTVEPVTAAAMADRYIGISKSAVTNAAAQIATLGAKVTNQSGLTPNALYYLTDTGTLSTTPNNRKIGKATSATDLIIDTDDVSSGAWVLLSTVTAAGSATVDIEQTFSGAFDEYRILFEGAVFSSTAGFFARLKIGGTYQTSSNYISLDLTQNSGATTYQQTNSTTLPYITVIANPSGYQANDSAFGEIHITKPTEATRYPQIFCASQSLYSNGTIMKLDRVHGAWKGSGVLTGVRLLPGLGVITSGTFRLYGIKK